MQKYLLYFVCIFIFSACLSDTYKNLKEGLYANIQTNKGDILVELYFEKTPMTVANFVSLAEGTNKRVTDSLKGEKFYDGVRFHRVVEDFIIQAGDKTESGRGNPGYVFGDEFPRDPDGNLILSHNDAGILSMANPGKDANGSQFFITHKPITYLDGKHTVFGKTIINSKQLKQLQQKFKDKDQLTKAIDSLRMQVVNTIKQFDTILKIEFIKIGEKAKKFDAAAVFEEEYQFFYEEIQAKKIEEDKKEVARYSQYLSDKQEHLKNLGLDKVKPTDSGLKLLKTKTTKGTKIESSKKVICHFILYTADGKKIQSTMASNSPFEFYLNDQSKPLITGFKEGVRKLREGEKALIYIPYYIGFGSEKYGPFPAKSDLIFEIEILKVE